MKKALILALAIITMAMTSLISVGAAETIPAPIAAYNFSDPDNIGKDFTGNGNDLTAWFWEDGAVVAEDGKVKLDGKSVLQALPDANGKDFTDSLTSFTFTIKASVQALPNGQVVLLGTGFDWDAYKGGMSLLVDNDWCAIDIYSNQNWRSTNFTDLLGAGWNANEHRYTIAYDDTAKTIKLWVDDKLAYTGDNVSGVNMNCGNTIFAIGCLNEYVKDEKNWCGYTGAMTADDVAVFDYALNDEQVKQLDTVFAEKAPDVPSDEPEQPNNPETADVLSVGVVTAAIALICGAVVVSKKRK